MFTPTPGTFPLDTTGSYSAPGDFAWYDLSVPAEAVVSLKVTSA